MTPTDSIIISLDKEAILSSGMFIPDVLKENLPDHMTLSFKNKKYLTKSELMMLETLVECNWQRPVYMAITASPEDFLCFEDNFIQEGLLYRITPFNMKELGVRMDIEKTYDCLMRQFKWGGMENDKIYLDENTLRMYAANRRLFIKLANELLMIEDYERAKEVLDYSCKVIPHHHLKYDYQNAAFNMAEYYFRLKDQEKGEEIITYLADKSIEYINWYIGMNNFGWSRVVMIADIIFTYSVKS